MLTTTKVPQISGTDWIMAEFDTDKQLINGIEMNSDCLECCLLK